MKRLSTSSIRHRLLGFISGLVLTVVVVYAGTAYREAQRSARLAASDRLGVVTDRLLAMLTTSVTQYRTDVARLAADRALAAYVHAAATGSVASAVRDSALRAMRGLPAPTASASHVELWATSGRRILSTDSTAPALDTHDAHALIALLDRGTIAAVGSLRASRDTLLYPVIGRISRDSAETGYVVQWRRLSNSAQGRRVLADLIGSDARLYIGDPRSDLWTDLTTRVGVPALDSVARGSGVHSLVLDGERQLALVRPIAQTPWTLVLAFSESAVLARPQAMLQRLALYALALLLLASAGAWVMSGRLTAPLGELVGAATAISAGDYSRRVAIARRDEIGQLGDVFNEMAGRIADAQHQMADHAEELEQQAIELEVANEDLQRSIAETEQARAAAEATAAEQQALINAMTDVVVVLDEDGRYVRVANPTHPLMAQRAERLSAGRRVHEELPPAAADAVLACVRRAITRGEPQALEYDLEIDGRQVWFAAVAAPMPERRVVWVARDVTERKRAEAELRLSNATLGAIVEGSPLAIIALDSQEIVRQWNPAAERIFGWSASEIVGQPYPIVPPDRQAEVAALRAAIERGEALAHIETSRMRRDGRVLDVTLFCAPLRDATGAPGGRVVILEDVTDRKRLEAQLRQAQKMEAVGQLAGGVAHDFNNLLTVITSYGGLLLRATPEGDPAHADLTAIRDAADRASALTRQLLAFSRQQVLRPQELDLNAVTRDMERLMRRLLREDIQLETRLDPALGRTHADPGQIEQVIMNLVVNARDAIPGSGRIVIETSNVELDAHYARTHPDVKPGRYVLLAVSDDGQGMDAATQARIFEPFFTTKGLGKGTGLGLPTAYGIVKQSGGHIWCYSELGYGTTFKLYFPLCEESVETSGPPAPRRPAPHGTETILLVEDEAPVRTVAGRILRESGYTVLEAANGDEALRLWEARAEEIDLIVTDMVMPHVGGREFASHVRARRPELPLVFMSGYTEDAVRQGSFLDRGSLFLDKPFSEESLATKVREALDTL